MKTLQLILQENWDIDPAISTLEIAICVRYVRKLDLTFWGAVGRVNDYFECYRGDVDGNSPAMAVCEAFWETATMLPRTDHLTLCGDSRETKFQAAILKGDGRLAPASSDGVVKYCQQRGAMSQIRRKSKITTIGKTAEAQLKLGILLEQMRQERGATFKSAESKGYRY
jgi:hypothetical protein